MQQYDVEKLAGAFRGKKRFLGYTLTQLARDSRLSVSCVAHVLEVGRARHETMDRIARALGFKGREDVAIVIGQKKRA